MPSTTSPLASVRASRTILLLTALMFAYLVNSLNKVVFPLLIDDIRHQFHLSLGQAGLQSTIFALGVGLAGIPGGFLLARLRRKTVVVIGTVTFSLATVFTAFAVGFWNMLITQTIAGVGEALQVTALLVIASGVLPKTPSAAVGSLNVIYGVSAIIGPAVATQLLTGFGTWRAPLITLAAVGLISAVAVVLFVPAWLTERTDDPAPNVGEATGKSVDLAVPQHLWNHNTRIMIVGGVVGSLVGFGYFGLYPTFLKSYHHYSNETVGIVVSIAGTGALLSILGGFLTDRFNPRSVLILAHIGFAVVGAALYAGPGAIAWQLPFAILGGVISNGILFVNVSAVLLKCVPAKYAPQAAGLFVVCWFTPGAFSGLIFGHLADVAGWSGAGLIQVTAGSVLTALVFALLRPRELRVSQPLAERAARRAAARGGGVSVAEPVAADRAGHALATESEGEHTVVPVD